MEEDPWFRWSLVYGIKPIHPNGWMILGIYLLIGSISGLAALGGLGDVVLAHVIGAIVFVASSVAFFWKVFERMA